MAADERLRSFIERVERLETEKADLSEDLKEVYNEAKGEGFDVPTMKKVVRLRKIPDADRREEAMLLETYMAALGMLATTPLGKSAMEREAQASEPPVQEGVAA